MISTKYGKMNVIPADKIISHSLSLYGEWAGCELSFLHKLVKPGMHVLDIGAFIGTHTLAFARFVGTSGQVYSFEPRKEIYQILCSNIEANGIKHVQAFNMGLAEAAGSIALESIDIKESVNFGGLSIDNVVPKEIANIYDVHISTVDKLNVPAVHFMKLDVEGMERRVLEGAIEVIARDQPLIFCECNSLTSGYEIFEFCQPLKYRVFGLLSAAYNPENFNGVVDNIFGNAKEVSLLLIPISKITDLDPEVTFDELFEIKDLEDFVLPLLHKPQYADEVLSNTNPASRLSLNFPSPLVLQERQERYEAQQASEAALAQKTAEVTLLESQLNELQERQERYEFQQASEAALAQKTAEVTLMESQLNELQERQERNESQQASEAALAQKKAEVTLLESQLNELQERQERYESQQASEAALAQKKAEVILLESQLNELSAGIEQRQQQIYALHSDIQNLLSSTSWRVTRPVRLFSAFLRKMVKLNSILVAYIRKNQGFAGFKKLFRTVWMEFRSGGMSGLKSKLQMFRQATNSPTEIVNFEAKQSANEIEVLTHALKSSELVVETIVFDHNGGGGSNTYTSELIASTLTEDASILRVYCWGGDWYIQLRNNAGSNNSLYVAASLEDLFKCLNASRVNKIVVNSLYGYGPIEKAIDLIVDLKNRSGSSIDFKVHDFHALCPSPHLSDHDQKFCGIPSDHEVCKKCLPKNLSWYHSWYTKSDMATDIDLWRAPFQRLFDACDVITCFDESSIEILRTDFIIEDDRINVMPHELQHFKCTERTNLGGALSIGIIGTLSHIKGGDVVKELCSYIDDENLDVPVIVIGESHTQLPANAVIHGRYSPEELPSLIDSLGVSVVFMASIVPETFSYTISEAIEMGVPIVAFDIGAQGRRVKEYRLGKVVPVGASPEEILTAAKSIYKAAKE
ncbi:FkbM family methyltransferase [Pseudomonas sp. ZS1P83]